MLAFTVHVGLAKDSLAPVFFLHALKLVGTNLGSLVPRYADIAALAAVLRVSLAVRIPIDAL